MINNNQNNFKNKFKIIKMKFNKIKLKLKNT